MIAIAGSKGGCGKSTVTLGLAEAFARGEDVVVAVDADRQLPNLHVKADLDREPTVAELEADRSIEQIVQVHPREPSLGIATAPKSSQTFEYDRLSEYIDDSFRTVIDCPSGAGPDVVDPMRQADGVVVVATETERGLEAAETTMEMARRLGVPIYGAVFNKCSGIPETATHWDVPLLGCIPERVSPLANEEVVDAFDSIASNLRDQLHRESTQSMLAGDRLQTGITKLDKRLGGVPPGSLIALVAEPASQSEQLLYQAIDVRGTLYLSTTNSRTNVRRSIEAAAAGTETPTIRRVSGNSLLEDSTTLIDKLPEAANLIIDTADELERQDRTAYVDFLNKLRDRLDETNGLAILHCLENDTTNRTATLQAADAVFKFESVAPGAGTDVEHYLSVPKFRPNAEFSETFEITFGERTGVGQIDPSPGSD